MLKQTIAIYSLLFTLFASADELPPEHFLSPRDSEIMAISGIESPHSISTLKLFHKRCQSSIENELCPLFSALAAANLTKVEDFSFNQRSQITFFGERHISPEVQFEMARIIGRSSSDDVQALALEMFNIKDQEVIDAYLDGLLTLGELQESLEAGWNYDSAGYLAMLTAAKAKGLKILALDDRARFSDLDFSANLHERDRHMAQILTTYLHKHPNDRIYAYSGKMHAFAALSRSTKIKTILELVRDQIPGLTFESYLFVGHKEGSYIRDAFRLVTESDSRPSVLKSNIFAPYVDGMILMSW